MNKNTRIPVVLVILGCICLAAFLLCVTKVNRPNIQQISANRIIQAHSVDELQATSELIVVAELQESENVLSFYSDGNVSMGYLKTAVTVKKAIKGDVSVGETLFLTEECYRTEDGTLWTQRGYLPLKQENSYLLFLSSYPDGSSYQGMFFPTELEYGKYLISEKVTADTLPNATKKDLQIGDGTDLDIYKEWFLEILDRYTSLLGG